MDEPLKRRGGRPHSKKRGTFSFRVTSELRANLEAEARLSGRPVSEIIEGRLERSYREDDLVERVADAVAGRIARGLMSDQGDKRRNAPAIGENDAACWPIVRAENWCSRYEVEYINENGNRLSHIAPASPVDILASSGPVNEQGRVE